MDAAFFTLYQQLAREGPGEPEDVAWATSVAQIKSNASICDAGCGSGADIRALLKAAPVGQVLAIDAHEPFVEEVRARVGNDPRVTVRAGDMGAVEGPFDFIWCAGALYFLGVTEGLERWRNALAPDGLVAFSEPCWFNSPPPATGPAMNFWAEYPAITDAAGIDRRVRAAGFETIATRRISDAAWATYYKSLQARVVELRPRAKADPELRAVLEAGQEEIDGWELARHESGYLLSVVRMAASP